MKKRNILIFTLVMALILSLSGCLGYNEVTATALYSGRALSLPIKNSQNAYTALYDAMDGCYFSTNKRGGEVLEIIKSSIAPDKDYVYRYDDTQELTLISISADDGTTDSYMVAPVPRSSNVTTPKYSYMLTPMAASICWESGGGGTRLLFPMHLCSDAKINLVPNPTVYEGADYELFSGVTAEDIAGFYESSGWFDVQRDGGKITIRLNSERFVEQETAKPLDADTPWTQSNVFDFPIELDVHTHAGQEFLTVNRAAG